MDARSAAKREANMASFMVGTEFWSREDDRLYTSPASPRLESQRYIRVLAISCASTRRRCSTWTLLAAVLGGPRDAARSHRDM